MLLERQQVAGTAASKGALAGLPQGAVGRTGGESVVGAGGGGINNECRSGQYVRVLIPVVVGGSEKTLESVLSGLAPSLWVVGGLRERERERERKTD